ncbi:magnesium transporter [Sunxiuqinia elliptica]|uniref:Magnesium transporter MgtE n=1 Tax=Sunxiuqinia elliptica TaxID=655355 RepID=A0A4R6H8X1_9BACT|nr:magnesium transporter [Sunxiuqinia elliptica]TDO04720.1 magnesium transporter [Sunxiuqinia elliptica]TDO64268.1 magnesium transporter [Sunxiuqinia elliptica]
MQFELNREFIDELKEFIEQQNSKAVKAKLEDLHPMDIAEIMDELNTEEAKFLYLLLEGEKASDVLIEIPENERRRFLKVLPPELIAKQFIEYMDSDDAADVVRDLEEDMKEAVLQKIADKEQAGDIADLLEYDEESAGGLMAKELIKVNENWTVQTSLKEISKQAEDIDEIYYVYVVDDDDFLKGILSLKKLILNPTHSKIKNLIEDDIHYVKTDATHEDVAMAMERFDLVAIPVVDHIGRLKGRITIDDVVDVIREEAERDYQMVSGITGDVESGDRVWNLTRARLPWLLIGLLGGILGARVLGANEEALSKIQGIAFFIPLIAAMAGNVGVQSSSIVVQTIASGARDFDSFGKKLLKELAVGLITAFVFSTLIFTYNFAFSNSMELTWAVSISLFIVIVFASLFGTTIPLLLNKLKIDPALATGPFITTMNDILGLMMYMLIAKLFFNII